MKTLRVAALLSTAFAVGGGGAELAVRSHAAVEKVRQDRELGAAGQLVELQLMTADGEIIARPRVIASPGKAAEVVLHDPTRPGAVRLAFRVEVAREPTGDLGLAYAVWVPGHDVTAEGRLSLTPGVVQAIELGDGALVATWMAVPVPSAAFDAYLEFERARRLAEAS